MDFETGKQIVPINSRPEALVIRGISPKASASSSRQADPHATNAVNGSDGRVASNHVMSHLILPAPSTAKLSSIHLLDLPIEIIEIICREYLDICSNTCFGLTCKALFNITEYLNPFQVNLYMRTNGICLGRLLTSWMAPKYSFDHSWGKFLPKKHYMNDDVVVERRWREKESWRKIRLSMDKMGACVAYESRSKRKGF